jgi:hypothetical protein
MPEFHIYKNKHNGKWTLLMNGKIVVMTIYRDIAVAIKTKIVTGEYHFDPNSKGLADYGK